MKDYYIRKIQLVSSHEYGPVIEFVASTFSNTCSEEQMRKCEKLGYAFCPTFVMRYTKYLHMTLDYKKKNWEPMTINTKEFVVEKHSLGENLPAKVFYINTALSNAGIWAAIKARLSKRK